MKELSFKTSKDPEGKLRVLSVYNTIDDSGELCFSLISLASLLKMTEDKVKNTNEVKHSNKHTLQIRKQETPYEYNKIVHLYFNFILHCIH